MQSALRSTARHCKHQSTCLITASALPRNSASWTMYRLQIQSYAIAASCQTSTSNAHGGRILDQKWKRQFQSLSLVKHSSKRWKTLEHSNAKGIADSSESGFNFRDILNDTMVAESIKDEDMGPSSGDEISDDIFVSQSGKLLLYPWRRWESVKEVSKNEETTAEKGKAKYPSVTGILQKTMSPASAMALRRWESFMIKKMGFAAFQKLKKEMFAEGHELHDAIGQVLLHKPEEVEIGGGIQGFWDSVRERLPEMEADSPIMECHVKHPYLGYHGYADCITQFRGEPCLVEFKTSRKPKKTLSHCFDNPLQVAAYLGALNFDPRHQAQVHQALLVITYKDGSPADLHVMTSDLCDIYWKKWLRRLQEYREIEGRQKAKKFEENEL